MSLFSHSPSPDQLPLLCTSFSFASYHVVYGTCTAMSAPTIAFILISLVHTDKKKGDKQNTPYWTYLTLCPCLTLTLALCPALTLYPRLTPSPMLAPCPALTLWLLPQGSLIRGWDHMTSVVYLVCLHVHTYLTWLITSHFILVSLLGDWPSPAPRLSLHSPICLHL